MTLAAAEPVPVPAPNPAAALPSWEALCAEHQPWALRLARRLLGWRGDADDAVQEAFLRAGPKLHTVREPAKLRGWLGALVANACRTQLRKAALRQRLLGWLRPAEEAPRSEPDDELAAAVRTALAALSADDRTALVLRYYEDWPLADIAAALGVKRNAAEVRLHRAKAKLAKLLEPWREDA